MAPHLMFATVIDAWASLYNNHKIVLGTVMFGHFAGLLVGGGMAVSFDLATLRLAQASDALRIEHLRQMAIVHRFVVLGLGLTLLTGVLMVLADVSTFLHSPAFWAKMAIIALLAGNGAVLTKISPALAAPPDGSWRRMTTVAASSLFLWFAATLAGVVLATTA